MKTKPTSYFIAYSTAFLQLFLLSSFSTQAQVIFSDSFERAQLGPKWTSEAYASWSIQDGKAYNDIDGSGGKLATTQSFEETNYVIETIAYPFEYGYQREYYLTFGEQSTEDSSYAIRYDAAWGGSLQIVKSTDNIYFPEVLASTKIKLNDSVPLKLRVEHTSDGDIALFISEVGTAYADTSLLQANDTTYPNLGKLGWHISTQTAAQDFFVESIEAAVLSTSPIIFEDDFERTTLGPFWESNNAWTIQNGQAYNAPDGNGSFLTTAQSFANTSYIIETEASNFVTGYYREYFLLFGQQDTSGDMSYVVNYDPDFGNILSLGRVEGNYFYPETLDDQVVDIDPARSYKLKVAKYENGLIQVFLGDENGFPEVPTLEAIDTTYATLGKVSWGNATQTAGEDFFVEYIKATVPETQKTEPEKPAEDELIKQFFVDSNNPYEVGKLAEGETFFTDRPYTLTNVPTFLQGASFVKTANDDKQRTDAQGFLQVYLKQQAVAYVAYDPRGTTLPAWLQDWTKTDEVIGTTDPGSAYYEVYTKPVRFALFETYPYQISIGANLAPPTAGSNMNYLLAFLPVSASSTYEAENASLSGPKVATNNSGFSGSGFADYINKNNDYVEWTVDVAATTSYDLSFRYANGSNSNRNLQVSLDGQVIDTLVGYPTADWSTWRSEDVALSSLSAGEHTIRLTAVGNSGPNVDYLRLFPSGQYNTGPGTTAARTDVSERTDILDAEVSAPVSVYPNPTTDQLDFVLDDRPTSLRVMDLQGKVVYAKVLSASSGSKEIQHHLDVSSWKTGTYVYQVRTGQGVITGKIVKVD